MSYTITTRNGLRTAPNQRLLTIRRESVKKNEKDNNGKPVLYTVLKNDNLYAAMKTLPHREFKLYMALVSLCSREDFTLAFSPQHLSELTGMSDDIIRKAFNELITSGFIVHSPEAKNHYEFHETTQNYDFTALYILYNGNYYTKQQLLDDPENNAEAIEAWWKTQQKYIKNGNRYVPVAA